MLEQLSKLITERAPKRKFWGLTLGSAHLLAKPDNAKLKKYLEAIDHKKDGLSHDQIAKELGLIAKHEQKDEISSTAGIDRRQRAREDVDYYLTRARQIIEGCEKGLFPAADDSPKDPTRDKPA